MIEGQEQECKEALCCCEFINNQSEKSHLLAIFCNCQEFDLFFTRCITCSNKSRNINKMLLTFQDRLRIPWRGGAKQVSFSVIAPAIAIPFSIAFAAINPCVTIIMFLSNLVFLLYANHYVRSRKMRTNFFSLWLLWSVVYMVVLFQFTVPLLEVLPEENFILVLLTGCTIFCLYRTYKRAALNQVLVTHGHEHVDNSAAEEADSATSLLIEPDFDDQIKKDSNSACKRCSKEALTTHCDVCSLCVLRRRHHSFWLNCCIGDSNYRHYLIGLLLAELSLLLGSNLTLTAICHPVLLQRIGGISIMFPDDCSEVYDEYRFSVAFVIASYALLIALFLFYECVKQVFILLSLTVWHKYDQSTLRQRKSFWNDGRSNSSYIK